jgi:hypothetical protein
MTSIKIESNNIDNNQSVCIEDLLKTFQVDGLKRELIKEQERRQECEKQLKQLKQWINSMPTIDTDVKDDIQQHTTDIASTLISMADADISRSSFISEDNSVRSPPVVVHPRQSGIKRKRTSNKAVHTVHVCFTIAVDEQNVLRFVQHQERTYVLACDVFRYVHPGTCGWCQGFDKPSDHVESPLLNVKTINDATGKVTQRNNRVISAATLDGWIQSKRLPFNIERDAKLDILKEMIIPQLD